MAIKWEEKYSVGIKEIDDQHKKLIELINDFKKAHKAGFVEYILASIFKSLLEYVDYHFTTEEDLMRIYGFTEYEEHKKEHEDLTKRTMSLYNDFLHASSPLIIVDTLQLLDDWLTLHLIETDSKYSEFLVSKGIN